MRRQAAVLLVLCVLTAGCEPETAEEELDFKATVTVEAARQGNVERVLTTTGTVRARKEAKMLAESVGELVLARNPATRERLRVGDTVKAGQLVATVAARELFTSSRLEARRAAVRKAEADHERNSRLREEGLVSQQVLDEQENLLSSARSEYENAVMQHGKARLVAPFAGILSKVTTASDGEHVAAGTVVAEVVEFDEVFVDLDLGSGNVLEVATGLPVRVRSYNSDRVFTGVVERLAPAIDPASRTFRVEVRVANADHALRPGMFVKADVVLESHQDVLVVPTTAVVEREGQLKVFIVEAQKVELRTVQVGLISEGVAEVTSGVSMGERVVVSGQETLQDGSRVNVRG